jgi:4'-phosphopantetheinyl transferase EntD
MSFLTMGGALRSFAERRDIRIAAREIATGDETRLSPEEAETFAALRRERRQASGAARASARELLTEFGAPPGPIGRDAEGVPLWPPGFAGSLAHDGTHALAAVARVGKVSALGVDLEPDAPMSLELAELVATPAERARYDQVLLRRPILFVIKEAVFKALFPDDRRFLDFQDIDIDLASGGARTKFGGRCHFAWEGGLKICALAARED